MDPMTERQMMLVRSAFVVALLATIGSLYFSEVAGYPPCKLCWLQRIAVYPTLAILAVGLVRRDAFVHLYVLPLMFFGLIVAIFHNLLYYKVISDTLAPCELGVSCTTKYIEWFGFATIPLLSLISMVLITLLMLKFRKEGMKE